MNRGNFDRNALNLTEPSERYEKYRNAIISAGSHEFYPKQIKFGGRSYAKSYFDVFAC